MSNASFSLEARSALAFARSHDWGSWAYLARGTRPQHSHIEVLVIDDAHQITATMDAARTFGGY